MERHRKATIAVAVWAAVALLWVAAPHKAAATCVHQGVEWTCTGEPLTEFQELLPEIDLACLGGQEAALRLGEDALLSQYYGRFVERLNAVEAAAWLRAQAASPALPWVNAIWALHAAFPESVRFYPACLPMVHYGQSGQTLPAGIFAMVDVRDEPTAHTVAAARSLTRVGQGAVNGTSRCNATEELVECERYEGSVFIGAAERSFLWQTPLGPVPAGGWPAVIHYHGSFGAPHIFSWRAGRNYPFGLYWQGLTIKALLDAGYAVITPESHFSGFLFWDTNLPVWRTYWERSPDHDFVLWMLAEMSLPGSGGVFGPLNSTRFYAAGLSSGAYMTSRMAVSYPGRFRALAVHSGSYANCAGPICKVPELPLDHPPTLFAHGAQDFIVNIDTMYEYAAQMDLQRLVNKQVVSPTAGHEWIPEAVEEIRRWFDLYA